MTNSPQIKADGGDWRDELTWYPQETALMRLAKFILKPILYSLARVTCEGADRFPISGPCVVAVNHISLWDVLYVGVSLPRYPHFMAKAELYRYPLFSFIIRVLGSFPVNRGEGDLWAMTEAGRILEAEELLVMFPEGTRSGRKAQLKRGKVGAIRLALKHGAPIVPAAVWGTENFRFSLSRTQINIRLGEPLDLVEMAGPPPHSPEKLRELTTILMEQIAAMLPPAYRGVYG